MSNWKEEAQERLNKREEEIEKRIDKVEDKILKIIGRELSSAELFNLRGLFAELDRAEQEAIRIQDKMWDLI